MDNFCSPLENNLKFGTFGYIQNKKPKIIMKEIKNLFLCQFIFSMEREKELKILLNKEFGLAKLPFLTNVIKNKNNFSMQTEIHKIWVCSNKKLNFNSLNKSPNLFPLDMTSSKTILKLSGDKSLELLNRLCSLELSKQNVFYQTTSVHHVSIGIYKNERNSFYLFLPRSFALSLFDLIFQISLQFGVKVDNS